jgi:outer membrane lipoprotein SlyB
MKRIIYLFLLTYICISPLFAGNSTIRGLFGGAGTGALIGGLAGGGRGAGWGALAGGLVGTAIGSSRDAERKRYYRNRYYKDDASRQSYIDDEYDTDEEYDETSAVDNRYRNRGLRKRSTRTS